MKINKRFKEYVDKKNFWNKLTKRPMIEFPLTQADVQNLSDALQNELSPENLCGDGEIPASVARANYKKLNNILNDLEKYAQKNNLDDIIFNEW